MSEDTPELETWQANGRIVLRKYGINGAVDEVMVNRGKKIQITEKERRLNQARVIDERSDPFANGTLSPVRLPESSDDSTKAIVESPNAVSDEELRELVDNAHHKTFEKRLGEITSPYVVRRMIKMTSEDDVDVTLKRVEALETRLRELTADKDVHVVEHVLPEQITKSQ